MTLVALLCGLALALAFPRAGLQLFAWIAPVPWLALLVHAPRRRALRSGFVFGLGFFGLLLAWVQRVLAFYTSLPPYLSIPIWALLVGYLAIYPALFALGTSALARRIGARALAVAPFLWVALEWARGLVLGGFPWGEAGGARAGGLALLQAARLGGIRLVSWLTVAAWCALAVLLLRAVHGGARSSERSRRSGMRLGWGDEPRAFVSGTLVVGAAAVLLLVVGATGLGALRLRAHPPADVSLTAGDGGPTRAARAEGEVPSPAKSENEPSSDRTTDEASTPVGRGAGVRAAAAPGASGGPLRVALIQGGYGGDLDLEQGKAALHEYLRRTREVAEHRLDLIVWPESNAPFQPERSETYLAALVDLSKRTGAALLLGAVGGSFESGLTNSAYLIDASGIRGRYDKIRLVQYGEYVPMQGLFPFIRKFVPEAGEFLPGSKVGVLPVAGRTIGISICYEMIFPQEIRRQARAGADLLINVTNDSWYIWGGPWQHAEFSSSRAIETGLYVLRCASSGRTLVIDPWGRVVMAGPLGGGATIETTVPPRGPSSSTPYVRLGDWPTAACVTISALSLAFLGVGNIMDKRRRTASRRKGNPRR